MRNSGKAYVKYLDGGCSSPVAAYGELHGDTLLLRGLYYREEGGTYIKGQLEGDPLRAEELGITLAKRLKESMEKESHHEYWKSMAGRCRSGRCRTFYSEKALRFLIKRK